jgi:hypothetical protein
MFGTGYYNEARGFGRTTAHATAGGYDRAVLYDSTGNDTAVAKAWGASLSGTRFENEARGFEHITAQLIHGGDDDVDADSVDYLFNLVGQLINQAARRLESVTVDGSVFATSTPSAA